MIEKRPALTLLSHLVLILGVAIVAFPLYLTLIASTQTAQQINQSVPMSLLPGGHGWATWKLALFGGETSVGSKIAPALPMLATSLVSALSISIGKIAISLLSAFAIVYFRFPLRTLVFWMVFVTLMLPVEVRIGPTYEVVAGLGLLNSYAGLTVPLIASATATFLFRQFFLTVPDELVEAARIDGASPMRFFRDVLLPLSALTQKDRADLDFGLSLGVDWVALSFVQRAEDVIAARERVPTSRSRAPLAPITNSRSQWCTSSAVWQVWLPNMWPLTQKSPVFSCASALDEKRMPSALRGWLEDMDLTLENAAADLYADLADPVAMLRGERGGVAQQTGDRVQVSHRDALGEDRAGELAGRDPGVAGRVRRVGSAHSRSRRSRSPRRAAAARGGGSRAGPRPAPRHRARRPPARPGARSAATGACRAAARAARTPRRRWRRDTPWDCG